ncbi:histidine kinase dimerization/phosphoacceptor domain -containing protein [Bradyrhizobium sp. 23AC]
MSGLSKLSANGGMTAERRLLREFAHRIDDELASAIDLVSKAASRCDAREARATLASLQERLESHVRLHHALQMPQFTTIVDLAAYLQQLCRSISRSSLEGEGISLSLLLHPLKMSSERCWLLGMIVFELVTSAAGRVSHGGTGAIHLEMWVTTTSVACSVTDNGSSDEGRHQQEERAIVEALLEHLNGTVDVHAGPGGATTVVSLPRWS